MLLMLPFPSSWQFVCLATGTNHGCKLRAIKMHTTNHRDCRGRSKSDTPSNCWNHQHLLMVKHTARLRVSCAEATLLASDLLAESDTGWVWDMRLDANAVRKATPKGRQ
eukprot:TRINITY_DN98814_c0_g1_i1.p1 TRINITY_DN98814_c0_g1~~TRINITY_DN98814_c0_g1_i1.p1  ORF type:complete len:109 (-),score=1.19 TRINITY_DN98814_c0_g1_i1:69-395(-)